MTSPPKYSMKKCDTCKLERSFDCFHRNRRNKDGFHTTCKECKKIVDKRYQENNKDKIKIRRHDYYLGNKDTIIKKVRKYIDENPDRRCIWSRQVRLRLKREVFAHYCGTIDIKCALCPETDINLLSIDHINGDGAKHRREMMDRSFGGNRLYRWLRKQGYPDGFQVLCMSCQYKKRMQEMKPANPTQKQLEKAAKAQELKIECLNHYGSVCQAMLDAAKPYLMRIVGPDSVGVQVPSLGLDASFSHVAARPGSIAFVSQSGAIVTAMLDWAVPHGVGFSHVVSLGDMTDIDFGDLLYYLATDAGTRAVLLYVETIPAGRKFMSAARAAARSKPVLLLKAGRSSSRNDAANSHCGTLSGAGPVFDAAFRRAGVLRVATMAELFEAAETSGSDARANRRSASDTDQQRRSGIARGRCCKCRRRPFGGLVGEYNQRVARGFAAKLELLQPNRSRRRRLRQALCRRARSTDR